MNHHGLPDVISFFRDGRMVHKRLEDFTDQDFDDAIAYHSALVKHHAEYANSLAMAINDRLAPEPQP